MPACPKPLVWESRAWLNWVKVQRCRRCLDLGHQVQADDPHHLVCIGRGAMGGTVPDIFTVPLCRPCHNIVQTTPEEWENQDRWFREFILEAIVAGALTPTPSGGGQF